MFSDPLLGWKHIFGSKRRYRRLMGDQRDGKHTQCGQSAIRTFTILRLFDSNILPSARLFRFYSCENLLSLPSPCIRKHSSLASFTPVAHQDTTRRKSASTSVQKENQEERERKQMRLHVFFLFLLLGCFFCFWKKSLGQSNQVLFLPPFLFSSPYPSEIKTLIPKSQSRQGRYDNTLIHACPEKDPPATKKSHAP